MIPNKILQPIVLLGTVEWIVNQTPNRVVLEGGLITFIILFYCFIRVCMFHASLHKQLDMLSGEITDRNLPDSELVPFLLAAFALSTFVISAYFFDIWFPMLIGSSISLMLTALSLLCLECQSCQNDIDALERRINNDIY